MTKKQLFSNLCFLFLCSAVAMTFFAAPVEAQGLREKIDQALYEETAGRRTISINVREKSIEELLGFIAGKANVNILVDEEIKAKVTIRLINVYWKNALRVITDRAGCLVEQISPNLYRVTKPPTVSMEFANAELSTVLDLLARQAGSNIIIANNVGGKVTLNLRDVHWKQALDTIVKTSGFVSVREEGNIIRVVRRDSLKDQLETEVLSLKYIRPPGTYRAAITTQGSGPGKGGVFFVGQAKAPGDPSVEFTLFKALSGAVDDSIGEKVIYDPVSNAFVVRATKITINRLKSIIDKVDSEPLQVFVDVKFIRTNSGSLLSRGFRFNRPDTPDEDGMIGRIVFDRADSTTSNIGVAGGRASNLRGIFPFEVNDNPEGLFIPNNFGIPGVLDLQQTLATLRLVKADTNTRIVQAPTLVTLNHHEATIFIGDNVPYAEQEVQSDQNGNLQVTLSEGQGSPVSVGFTLFITPNVIPDTNKLSMSIITKFNNLTGTTAAQNQGPDGFERFSFGGAQGTFIDLPRTKDQTIVTNLMLTDRQTAVIGGLYSQNKRETVSKIPILSSIPIIGNLFTFRENDTTTENLIIFITPTIIRNSDQLKNISRERIIRFSETDYFHEKAKGNARDGKIEPKPVDPGSYKGVISNLYKEEVEFQNAAKEKYEQISEEADQQVQKGEYQEAILALQAYPSEYRDGTKYGKLIEQKISEVREQQRAAEKAKKAEKN